MIELRGLAKSFGSVRALAGIDLSVRVGERLVLLGASGCGKTTLLRLIAGLEVPDAGTISIDDIEMAAVPAHRRPVNMMFQSYALFPHMTVAGNIAFGLRPDGLARAEIAARVAEMLALVRLEGLAERKPHQLSGGQKSRVALARALAKRPKALLLDEPLAALDKKLREELRADLVAVQRRLGIAFVMVTHDQDEALAIADRIAVMDAGRIVQEGAPSAVYDRPRSRFVAEFLGLANLFAGRVIAREQGYATVRTVEAGDIVAAADGAISIGAAVWVAVRPERIALDPAIMPAPRNPRRGIVRAVAFLGNGRLLDVELAGGARIRVAVQNAADPARSIPAIGTEIVLAWCADASVVLDE